MAPLPLISPSDATPPALDAWTFGVALFRAWSQVRTDDSVCGGAPQVALECCEERPWCLVQCVGLTVEDPKGKRLEAVRKVRDEIQVRIVRLVAEHAWGRG